MSNLNDPVTERGEQHMTSLQYWRGDQRTELPALAWLLSGNLQPAKMTECYEMAYSRLLMSYLIKINTHQRKKIAKMIY